MRPLAGSANRRLHGHAVTILRVSPQVLRDVQGPYRFFFYSNESSEPPHVHARRERKLAKFWLEPLALAMSRGFAAHELTLIQAIVEEHQAALLEAWHDFHSRRADSPGN